MAPRRPPPPIPTDPDSSDQSYVILSPPTVPTPELPPRRYTQHFTEGCSAIYAVPQPLSRPKTTSIVYSDEQDRLSKAIYDVPPPLNRVKTTSNVYLNGQDRLSKAQSVNSLSISQQPSLCSEKSATSVDYNERSRLSSVKSATPLDYNERSRLSSVKSATPLDYNDVSRLRSVTSVTPLDYNERSRLSSVKSATPLDYDALSRLRSVKSATPLYYNEPSRLRSVKYATPLDYNERSDLSSADTVTSPMEEEDPYSDMWGSEFGDDDVPDSPSPSRNQTLNVTKEKSPLKLTSRNIHSFFGSTRVIPLDESSYNDFLFKEKALVMFYNPFQCESVFPGIQFGTAAAKIGYNKYGFGSIDCSKQKCLCQRENALKLPMFKLYSNGFNVSTIRDTSTINAEYFEQLVKMTPVLNKSRAEMGKELIKMKGII